MIRKAILATALVLLVAPAYADDAGDIATAVNAYNDTLNKNDFPGAAAYYAPNPVIIDEFTPHVWSGANAFAQWGQDYGAFAQGRGMTEPVMTLDKPVHAEAEGDRGYAVFPATFHFKLKGTPTDEPGMLTFAMQKIGGKWKITGWSWSIK